jgi:hypothetical protein
MKINTGLNLPVIIDIIYKARPALDPSHDLTVGEAMTSLKGRFKLKQCMSRKTTR